MFARSDALLGESCVLGVQKHKLSMQSMAICVPPPSSGNIFCTTVSRRVLRPAAGVIADSMITITAALACHPRKTVGCISDERFTFCAPPPSRLHFLHNGQRFVLRRIPGRSGRKLRPLQCHLHSRRGISEQARPSPTSSVSSASHHAAESTSSCAAANT